MIPKNIESFLYFLRRTETPIPVFVIRFADDKPLCATICRTLSLSTLNKRDRSWTIPRDITETHYDSRAKSFCFVRKIISRNRASAKSKWFSDCVQPDIGLISIGVPMFSNELTAIRKSSPRAGESACDFEARGCKQELDRNKSYSAG